MEISYEDFKKIIIKTGTVLEVKKNEIMYHGVV